MSFDPTRYPKDWKALRARVLDRAGHRCEGSPDHPGCRAENHQPHPDTGSKVVLTVAHLCQDSMCGDETHLRALCQRCHLNFDRAHNNWKRALVRFVRWLRKNPEQLTLFSVEELVEFAIRCERRRPEALRLNLEHRTSESSPR